MAGALFYCSFSSLRLVFSISIPKLLKNQPKTPRNINKIPRKMPFLAFFDPFYWKITLNRAKTAIFTAGRSLSSSYTSSRRRTGATTLIWWLKFSSIYKFTSPEWLSFCIFHDFSAFSHAIMAEIPAFCEYFSHYRDVNLQFRLPFSQPQAFPKRFLLF